MKFAFTIATANYLAQAKTAGDSLLANNADYQFIIFLLDRVSPEVDTRKFPGLQIIEVESLQLPYFEEMLHRYTIFELSNALKPFLASHIFRANESADVVVYIDSDVFIYNPFTDIHRNLELYDIILTPHVYTPMPLDGLLIDEKTLLNSGIYNGGFFALKRSDEVHKFLTWWKDRLRTECFIDFNRGLFVDQLWLNLVPIYFKGVHILNHVGYNVAFWNFYERSLSFTHQKHWVNEQLPLILFHFSGYDFRMSESISRYQTRYTFAQRPDVVSLFEDYHQRVMQNGYLAYADIPWAYDMSKQKKTISGSSLQVRMKRFLRKLVGKMILNS
jgi:hypothetical protein